MVSFRRTLREAAAIRRVLGRIPARHTEPSIIASPEDGTTRATERLLDIALGAARRARRTTFPDLDRRISGEPRWYETWPGEHYKLLHGVIAELGAHRAIEIGTSTGMGTLSIAEGLPPGGQVTTFDIVPWREFKQTWLTEADFSGARIAQEIADIAKPGGIAPFGELFRAADFIFVDGPKDGVTERRFIDALGSLKFEQNPIVMFDDIRVLNMIEIWRRLDRPKLDLTSFGHWSGTGLVDWNG
jgi:predicted O-methyltransferase YrrM